MKFLYVYSTLILFFSYYQQSKAQSISELDKKNGFKDFKIGDPKSKWSSELTSRNSTSTNLYTYNGNCCKEAFGSSLSSIGIAFDKEDKIKTIILIFKEPKQGDELRRFLGTIEQAFGEATAQESNDKTGDMTHQWAGKNTILTVKAIYKGASSGGWEMSAIVAGRLSGSKADF